MIGAAGLKPLAPAIDDALRKKNRNGGFEPPTLY